MNRNQTPLQYGEDINWHQGYRGEEEGLLIPDPAHRGNWPSMSYFCQFAFPVSSVYAAGEHLLCTDCV